MQTAINIPNLTRQDLALMLRKYASLNGIDNTVTDISNLNNYTDKSAISSYATEGVSWAVANGLISGTGNGTTVSPKGTATRAMAALIIANLDKNVINAE